jgi:hypothetical protein
MYGRWVKRDLLKLASAQEGLRLPFPLARQREAARRRREHQGGIRWPEEEERKSL